MSQTLETGAAGFLARHAAARARLPGDPAIRARAAEAFRAVGLPGATRGRRAEAWKYTSLRPLAGLTFDASPDAAAAPAGAGPRLAFVAGRFRADLSAAVPGFTAFAEQAALDGDLSDPIAALNTMLAEDGAVLTIPDGHDAGRVFLSHTGIDGTSAHPRHVIRLGAGARLTLIETSSGDGCYLHNPVSDIQVAEGAVLTHVRIQTDASAAFHLAAIRVTVAAGGTYDGFTLNAGARIARTDLRAVLDGAGATAHLNGAQLLSGQRHADFTSVVRHAAPRGTSRQTVKNVLAGQSHGVFQGRIEVARGAQGTDGYQMNRALLLSPDAEIDTKPELEIFADDVKCSHGCTVGELDAEQLFFLRARGIPEHEGRSILVRAFLEDALEPVTDDTAREMLETEIARWWEGLAL